jgi:hypothetical protein
MLHGHSSCCYALLEAFDQVPDPDRIPFTVAAAHDGIRSAGGIDLNRGPDEPVRMLTEATCEIEILSSLEPMSRGLMRDTRCGVTSMRSGNQKLPAVQRLALKTYFSSAIIDRVDASVGFLRLAL